jgi:hypothetical protein
MCCSIVLVYCFLIFCYWLHVCACVAHVLLLRSWIDVEPPEQYQEQPSSEQFEQQPGEYKEGTYNMNLLSFLNTISYCILILYAYKDFPSHFITLYIYPMGCILVRCARLLRYNISWSFLINSINGLMQLNSGADPLCCVLEWFVRP